MLSRPSPAARAPPMNVASTRKQAMPLASGNTSSDLSSISTFQLCRASAMPLAILPTFAVAATGVPGREAAGVGGREGDVAGEEAGALGIEADAASLESNPQLMQSVTSFGISLVHFGQRFMLPSRSPRHAVTP